MLTKFNPSDTEKGSGLTAFASWDNPDMKFAMSQLFKIRANERIETIEVTEEGITARIAVEYNTLTNRSSAEQS